MRRKPDAKVYKLYDSMVVDLSGSAPLSCFLLSSCTEMVITA
nr:MAG TPA: hypothetical protein [Caudoviricetes sp.]